MEIIRYIVKNVRVRKNLVDYIINILVYNKNANLVIIEIE